MKTCIKDTPWVLDNKTCRPRGPAEAPPGRTKVLLPAERSDEETRARHQRGDLAEDGVGLEMMGCFFSWMEQKPANLLVLVILFLLVFHC